jgi:HEAT repeat protein
MTCELADRLGLDRVPLVLASDRTDMPFATGFWRSAIVLPAAAREWTEDRLRVVLLHELAHVRRRDLVGHTLSRLACALYWFHPLVWAAARRLRDESEKACDDLVLASGARASDYAGHLLDIVASARRGRTPAVALPMARRREFEGRVLAILDPRERRPPGRRQSAALLGMLGLLFFSVAAAAPSQPARPEAAPTVALMPANEPPAAVAPATPATVALAQDRPAAARPVAAAAQAPQAQASAEATGARKAENRALLVRVLRTDAEGEVRKAAAWALADSADADAVQALVSALGGDKDDDVRETAAWALSGSRREGAATALAEALRKDASAEVRKTAAWALGQGDGTDTAGLLAAIADPDPEVREAAVWAVGQHRTDKAPPQVVAALGDADASVRVVAAWALGEILDPATAPAVKAAFAKETDDEARRALFRALVFLGDGSRETLERALESKDPELRSRAVQMLAGSGPGVWPWPWPRPEPRPEP